MKFFIAGIFPTVSLKKDNVDEARGTWSSCNG
jgi:hypothetical protein